MHHGGKYLKPEVKHIGHAKFLTLTRIHNFSGHCKKLAPEFAGAAQELAKVDPVVMLGKVDATVEKKLGERFGVQGFPTLFWFK